MTEFILDQNGRVPLEFTDLDAFTQGYIEALFFTNQGDRDDEIPEGLGFFDLAPVTLVSIIQDCARFQAEQSKALTLAYDVADYDENRAGCDLWFTRCGHGCGYWDRNLGEAGDALTEAAGDYGNVDAYTGDDGRVYLA